MKTRPEIIGEKVELLGLYSKVSSEEMESARVQALKHFESAAGQAVENEPAISHPARPVRKWHWPVVAATAAAIAMAVLLPNRILESAPAVLEDEKGLRNIQYGELVRPIGDMSAMLSMADGPRVEMRSESEFSLERTDDGGTRIRLNKGGLIVDAAGQRSGNLSVETKDMMASVSGAVSLVKAEEQGSRVAAIGGSVRVQQGATEKKLRAGEQVTSNPKMESIPVKDELVWSRESITHLAMLAQAPTSASVPREERLAFEVATIRPVAPRPAPPVGARGGADSAAVNCAPRGQLDRRRLFMGNVSLYELIGVVYAYCADNFAKFNPVVLAGPGWIKSEHWDVEALIPEAAVDPLPTGFNGPDAELWEGRSPKVQKMLQTLLEERFKIVVRREMKEMSAYVLTVAPGGPQFQRKAPGNAVFIALDGKRVTTDEGAEAFRVNGAVRCDGNPCNVALFWNMPLSVVTKIMSGLTGRPVLDRTGIRDKVSFRIEWSRDPSISWPALNDVIPDRGDLVRAFEAIGLKLEEDPKGLVETWVIERAEKPLGN